MLDHESLYRQYYAATIIGENSDPQKFPAEHSIDAMIRLSGRMRAFRFHITKCLTMILPILLRMEQTLFKQLFEQGLPHSQK